MTTGERAKALQQEIVDRVKAKPRDITTYFEAIDACRSLPPGGGKDGLDQCLDTAFEINSIFHLRHP